MKLLAIDPGQNVGWAVFNTDRQPILEKCGVEKPREKFYSMLSTRFWNDIDILVYEDYKIRPAKYGYNHNWNSSPALRVIGALEYWAQNLNITIVAQQPSIKPIGYGFLKMTYKKGKTNVHHIDAMAHGMFYLVKNKIIDLSDIRPQDVKS